ncbi:MAG: hypothetical protein FJ146_08985 [Deltaproteobacteria bacterium]|nr:hypothetical protein [Deltaproteobacteria bacterium]
MQVSTLKRLVSPGISLVAASILWSCGSAKPATPQPRGVLPVPTFPSDPAHPFLLTDGENTVNFNASLIFWDKTPSPEQVKAILEHTHGARVIKSQALVELSDQVIADKESVVQSRSNYDAFNPRIREASGDVDKAAVRDFVGKVADGLFATRLGELATQGLVDSNDIARAEALWPAYCEAKLWELAVNTQLGRDFLARPTPLQMCEPYYAARQYFSNAELCGPSTDGAGKNYFMCIWSDGLLKSALFAENYKTAKCTPATSPMASRYAALESWLGSDGGILRATLTGSDPVAAAGLERTILLGDLIDRKATAFKDCRGAFTRKEPTIASLAEIPDWTQFKPETLLQIGEMGETSSAEVWRLIPLSSSDERNKQVYSQLVRVIKAFAERPSTSADLRGQNTNGPMDTSAETGIEPKTADVASMHPVPSYSDAVFNQVVGQSLAAKPADVNVVESDAAFAGLVAFESPAVKKLKLEQAQAYDVWSAAVVKYQTAKTHYDGVSKPAIDNNRLSTVDVVKDPGAAVFLNNYFLNVTKMGGELRVQLGFDLASKNLFGCVNSADGSQCAVATEQLGTSGEQLQVAFDSAANLITVKFSLADAAALGFADLPRTPGGVQFNEMLELRDRFVQIENYGNQLPGELRIITGNAYVLDAAGNKLYTGSITGDNFAQREQALSSNF